MALMKTIAGLGLLALAVRFSIAEDQSQFSMESANSSLPNGVASGDTTRSSTVLWARSTISGSVRFQISNQHGSATESYVKVSNPAIPAKLHVLNLQAGTRYSYKVTTPDGQSIAGSFKTAGDSFSDQGLSFGVSGDWRGDLAPYPALANIDSKDLDFFVKLGDTIYADIASPAAPKRQVHTLDEYRAKHQEVYSSHFGINSFAKLQRNVSVFATIDDHELINDFAGGAAASQDPRFGQNNGLINSTALYKNGLQAFTEYNPILNRRYAMDGDPLTDGRPDLYRSQRYGKTAAIFLLDARSFRDEELNGISNIADPVQIGRFMADSFDAAQGPTRTMLGSKQFARLRSDLLASQKDGVTWKFVLLPEPVQNLGVLGASDRYEGYASERSELLQFIDEQNIKNVVFVSADIHGTLINDLSYQRREDILSALANSGNPLVAPQKPTSAFEITTGSIAFAPAFGDAITGLLSIVPGGNELLQHMFTSVRVQSLGEFKNLPISVKNAALQDLINNQLIALGYTPIGLQDNRRIKAKLMKGSNSALYTFGWTRFEIKPHHHELIISTYGIEPYSADSLTTNADEIIKRLPKVVSQLKVAPQ